MMSIREQALAANKAERQLAVTSTKVKNAALLAMAEALLTHEKEILKANALDLKAGKKAGMRQSFIDRLLLNHKRLAEMAEGLQQVAELADPIGKVLDGQTLPNGLTIVKKRVPLGVIGIIYEARPNVTADAIGLCLKSGNAVILKGGSEAIRSNTAVAEVLTKAAEKAGIPQGSIQFITSTDHEAVTELITLNGLVDCVIPRGGAGLIHAVVRGASVPVIETGLGLCHTYVDEDADFDMAEKIIINAKTQRPAVCNAMETLLVHKKSAPKFLPGMLKKLQALGVEIYGDKATQKLGKNILVATENNYATEYDDLKLSVKVVKDLDEALNHIAKFGTKHSECIVTNDYAHARKFQECVDAACVYVNASTRFTDGFQFGFGAEIGISTQKLHARGPMALPELTTIKYLINGDGQVRA
jgi:glutamate-5-semialdehyde dehydrogenase